MFISAFQLLRSLLRTFSAFWSWGGANPLCINELGLCLWIKLPIDNYLTYCVSSIYPPRFYRPREPMWNVPTSHLFSQSPRKAPAEFRFAPSTLRNVVPSGAAHEAAAGHTLSEPSVTSESRATTVARRDFKSAYRSCSRNRRAAYCEPVVPD